MRTKTVYGIIALFLIQALSASFVAIPAQNEIDLFFPESSDTSARNNSSGVSNNNSSGNNSTANNDSHCLTLDNLSINTTYYVSIELVNICNTSINYPGINVSADDSGVSGFYNQTNWWYVIGANDSYTLNAQLEFDSSIQDGTNITLNFNTWILNCGSNNSWHDCPDSSDFGNMSLQFTYVNTTSNTNICGADPSLTDLFVSIDNSNWASIPSIVEGHYYVNCTVIGNHYWLEATIWSGSTSSYFSTSWQENDTYESFSEDWLNLSTGTHCVNVTLWDTTGGSQNYVDNEYPCFTLTSSGGNNTGGNNTGGNTSNEGNNTGCGYDVNNTEVVAFPTYSYIVDNESIPTTMYVECGIWNATMMLDYWIYDQNNNTVDSGNYTWNGTPSVFELNWNATGLDEGSYNFHADLYVDGIFVDSDDEGFSVIEWDENESNDCANIQCDGCPPGMVSDPDGGCCACMEEPDTNVDNGSNNTAECTPWNNVECNDEFGCKAGERIPVLAIDEVTGEVMLDSDGNQIEVWGCSESSSGEGENEASEIPSIGVLGTIAAISIGFAIISRKKD